MKKGNYLKIILRSKKTVFSFKDIALLWRDSSSAARVRINYYVKHGDLYRIHQGFYAKDKNYNRYELATKIYSPSYISFETVLGKAGIVFQYYSQIFVTSYLTREITVDEQVYSYRKIKDSVLTNSIGIEHKRNYSIATPERAFLDVVYLNKDYHFDNLSTLDWNKLLEILPIYQNKRMGKEINFYLKEYGIKHSNS
jgi:predicted transcriptional regulator of viral defense system